MNPFPRAVGGENSFVASGRRCLDFNENAEKRTGPSFSQPVASQEDTVVNFFFSQRPGCLKPAQVPNFLAFKGRRVGFRF